MGQQWHDTCSVSQLRQGQRKATNQNRITWTSKKSTNRSSREQKIEVLKVRSGRIIASWHYEIVRKEFVKARTGHPGFFKGKKRPEFSKLMKGRKVWNKGVLGWCSQESLEIRRMKSLGVNNAMYGLKGNKHPGYGKIGSLSPRVICPHCNKTLDKGNAKRYHFDKCKSSMRALNG